MNPTLRPLAALIPIVCAIGAPLPTQEPEFVDGDLADLRCQVVGVTEGRDGVQRLEVEVRNRSDAFAEPLQFVTKSSGRRRRDSDQPTEWRFDRARMPLVGRFGTSIPPGESRRYFVNTLLEWKRSHKIEIVAANFHKGAAPVAEADRPRVENLREARGRNDFTGLTHDIAVFEIVNPLPRAADVWLLADYESPMRETSLLAYRVRSGETLQVELGSRAHWQGFDDSGRAFAVDVELDDIRVVDWVEVGSIDHASARNALLELSRSWAIWPAGIESIRATFETDERGKELISGDQLKLRLAGSLVIGRDRRVTVNFDERSSRIVEKLGRENGGFQRDTEWLVRLATRFLRRRTESALAQVLDDGHGEAVWVTDDSLLLRGVTFDSDDEPSRIDGSDPFSSAYERFGLRDGRIAFDGHGTNTSNDWVWTTDELGSSWVVEKRHFEVPHSSTIETETWEHALLAGMPVIEEFRYEVERMGEPYSTQVIRFSDWSFEIGDGASGQSGGESAAEARPAPSGPGREALEAAWSRLHQFPDDSRGWRGDLSVDTNGTDGVWQGWHRFDADLGAVGIGHRPTRFSIGLRGKGPADTESMLANVILDRLGIWFANDLQTRGSFESYFRGAEIGRPGRDGWFKVEDHDAARIRVVDDLIREVVWSNGTHQRFHYEHLDDQPLLTRFERDLRTDQEVLVRYEKVDGRIVPVRFEFLRIFGPDWGPEVFVVSNVRLTDR